MTQPKGIQHVEPADADELSSLERHCLLKRICEVHEVIQQALLGVDAARGNAVGAPDLVVTCESLQVPSTNGARGVVVRSRRAAANAGAPHDLGPPMRGISKARSSAYPDKDTSSSRREGTHRLWTHRS